MIASQVRITSLSWTSYDTSSKRKSYFKTILFRLEILGQKCLTTSSSLKMRFAMCKRGTVKAMNGLHDINLHLLIQLSMIIAITGVLFRCGNIDKNISGTVNRE
ncbi:hypothetical protein TNCV_3002591 [Trichonephila clavipes]|nr:hypothetical protein TNCV_3002591 [Trichonephila clavipes]